MANNTRYEYFYFGQWGGYEEYYAFGLTYDDVYNTLWKMYLRNCEYNDYEPTEEDRETFDDEVFIQEFRNFNIINGFGFNTRNTEQLLYINPLNSTQIISGTPF